MAMPEDILERPVCQNLPVILQQMAREENSPFRALCTIIDHFFSDIERTIDTIDEHFDCDTAHHRSDDKKDDFLSWLASWVGLVFDEYWKDERRKRHILSSMAKLYQHRGTVRGLKMLIEYLFTINVEIREWEWPEGLVIGRSSTTGVDTVIRNEISRKACFTILWKTATVPSRALLTKIRTVIDREKPAHTHCFLQVVTDQYNNVSLATKEE